MSNHVENINKQISFNFIHLSKRVVKVILQTKSKKYYHLLDKSPPEYNGGINKGGNVNLDNISSSLGDSFDKLTAFGEAFDEIIDNFYLCLTIAFFCSVILFLCCYNFIKLNHLFSELSCEKFNREKTIFSIRISINFFFLFIALWMNITNLKNAISSDSVEYLFECIFLFIVCLTLIAGFAVSNFYRFLNQCSHIKLEEALILKVKLDTLTFTEHILQNENLKTNKQKTEEEIKTQDIQEQSDKIFTYQTDKQLDNISNAPSETISDDQKEKQSDDNLVTEPKKSSD